MREHGKVILGFILVGVIVIFSVINTGKTTVNFGIQQFDFPLIFVIVGSAVVGALIVVFTLMSNYWKQRKEIKILKNQLEDAKKETASKVMAEGAELYAQLAAKDQKIIELERQIKIYAEGYTQPISLTDIDEHIAD